MILPETFDLTDPMAVDSMTKSARRYVEPYLRGPITLVWLQKAISLNHSALATGLAIWHLRALKKTETFPTNLRTLGKITGLSKKATRNGLTALENAGLVRVERPLGKNQVITLITGKR